MKELKEKWRYLVPLYILTFFVSRETLIFLKIINNFFNRKLYISFDIEVFLFFFFFCNLDSFYNQFLQCNKPKFSFCVIYRAQQVLFNVIQIR